MTTRTQRDDIIERMTVLKALKQPDGSRVRPVDVLRLPRLSGVHDTVGCKSVPDVVESVGEYTGTSVQPTVSEDETRRLESLLDHLRGVNRLRDQAPRHSACSACRRAFGYRATSRCWRTQVMRPLRWLSRGLRDARLRTLTSAFTCLCPTVWRAVVAGAIRCPFPPRRRLFPYEHGFAGRSSAEHVGEYGEIRMTGRDEYYNYPSQSVGRTTRLRFSPRRVPAVTPPVRAASFVPVRRPADGGSFLRPRDRIGHRLPRPRSSSRLWCN